MNEIYTKIMKEFETDYGTLIEDMKGRFAPNRWTHVEGCVKEAYSLAVHYDVDPKSCMLGALFHDLFRELPAEELFGLAEAYGLTLKKDEKKVPGVLHGPVAAVFLEKNNYIADEEILQAIEAHTLGIRGMGDIGKILFITDAIEETRTYPDVNEMRTYVYSHTLDEAYAYILQEMFVSMIRKGKHIFKTTVDAYNECMEELYDRN